MRLSASSSFVALALAACGASLAPGTLRMRTPDAPPAPRACAPEPELPDLDARFRPKTAGAVALASARGDARLSAEGPVLATWSRDGRHIVLADGAALSLWRADDGGFVDLATCGKEMGANVVAVSADLRWLAVSGVARGLHADAPATCIVDLASHAARVLPLAVGRAGRRFALDASAGLLHTDDADVDLATGDVRRHPPAPAAAPPPTSAATIDLEGATGVAISHDGRYLAAWTEHEAFLLGDSGAARTSRRAARTPPFLAVWERATGRRLWKDATRCCDGWRFTDDDRFLAPVAGRGGAELLRATTGEVLAFPGTLLAFAPDGARVVVLRTRGPEIWNVDPPSVALAPLRPRNVLARSADGRVVVAHDGRGTPYAYGELVLEHDGRCIALGEKPSFEDPIAFTPDGRALDVGFIGQATVSTSRFERFATDTGETLASIEVEGRAPIRLMPAAGRVGFDVPNGIRVFDVASGRPLFVADAPRVSSSTPNAQGTSWNVRDDDGDRTDAFASATHATADGRYLVGESTLYEQPVSIWDLYDRRGARDLAWAGEREVVGPVALSPDERFVAAAMWNGVVMLWTRGGRSVPVASRHAGVVDELSFSRNGRLLASASRDGVVHVTDTATGAALGDVALVSDRATHLWFTADGSQLLVDTARGFVLTLSVAAGEERGRHRTTVPPM
ncbi:MAG TPA: WD40 repeat domain-containing protein [Labilithrix sp.]